jgi:hypothetical protein
MLEEDLSIPHRTAVLTALQPEAANPAPQGVAASPAATVTRWWGSRSGSSPMKSD